MNVLSLFDGISCGRIALDRAGVPVTSYLASEIDPHAISISKSNYPDIIQMGDVSRVKTEGLPSIDLLMGGSPCQGFSCAGKRLNFKDPRSELFFQFMRILGETKPKFFLLENVLMDSRSQGVISMMLGVEPVSICSSLVSAQRRPRLYWTNIPGLAPPPDRGVKLRDILDSDPHNYEFVDPAKTVRRKLLKNYMQYDINGTGHGSQDQRAFYLGGKHGCLTTRSGSQAKILLADGRVRKTTRLEAERLQCVPEGYTRAVGKSQAFKALGNGWTVDVIAHIFKNIHNYERDEKP